MFDKPVLIGARDAELDKVSSPSQPEFYSQMVTHLILHI